MEIKKKPLFQTARKNLYRWVLNPITDAKDWVRYRTWEKYHILKLRSLTPGWTDRDEVLVHALFQVFCDFIEQERPDRRIDYESDETHIKTWKEMQSLYNWWKNERPKRQDPIDGVEAPETLFGKPDEKGFGELKSIFKNPEHEKQWNQKCEESLRWEERCRAEDNEMMKRLIDIRDCLWT